MYFISLLFFPLLFPFSMKLPVRSLWTFENACNWDNSLNFKCSDSKATFLSVLSQERVQITVPKWCCACVPLFTHLPSELHSKGGAGSHLSGAVTPPVLPSFRTHSGCGTHCEKGWLFTQPTACSTVLHSKIFAIRQQWYPSISWALVNEFCL